MRDAALECPALGGNIKTRRIVLTVALCFVTATVCFAAEAFTGTWKRNELLNAELANSGAVPAIEDLAGLDEEVTLTGKFWDTNYKSRRQWYVKTTWRKVFAHISPYLVRHPGAAEVKEILASAVFRETTQFSAEFPENLDDQDFQTVGVQLKALGLVKIEYLETIAGGTGLFWSFTGRGERLMVELRTVRTKTTTAGDQSKS